MSTEFAFNFWGWYTGEATDGESRKTSLEPTNKSTSEEVGAPRSNWTGYQWEELPYQAPPEIPAPVPQVPFKVTRRQARQALFMTGVSLETVDQTIAALPEPTRTISRIFWEDSNDFERNNSTLNAIAPALGLSQAQLDQLFILAATL